MSSQKTNEKSLYARAVSIAKSRRIHKASTGNMWMVESSDRSFYTVRYIAETDTMECSCPAFAFTGGICKHCLSIALLKEIMDNKGANQTNESN
jgi:hypothetical protein